MEILLLLLPLSAVLLGVAAWAFVWSVNHKQFDDLERSAMNIFDDDDREDPHE
ncbi:MAG: cbb3-type cytochrome oxidase assembly protein CcoS [Pseudomonadota bacterium]